MTFGEYVEMHFNKSMNTPTVIDVELPDSPKDAFSFSKDLDPKKWTGKIIGEDKFLFFNNHYLNISKLKQEIHKLYVSKGYTHYGFDKLSEGELIRYKTVKDFLSSEFLKDCDCELNPIRTAEIIFNHEFKDFDWRPEKITL